MKPKYILIEIILMIIIFSPKVNFAQSQISKKEIAEILTGSIQETDSVCLVKDTYFSHPKLVPNSLVFAFKRFNSGPRKNLDSIDHEPKIKQIIPLFNNLYEVISPEELNEMLNRGMKWTIKKWDSSYVKFMPFKLKDSFNDVKHCRRMIRVSEPIFTQDKKKAIIYVYNGKPNGGGSKGIDVFKKENDIWVRKGGHPLGTSH